MISLKVVTEAKQFENAIEEAAGYLRAIQELPPEVGSAFSGDLAVVSMSIELWEDSAPKADDDV